MKVRLELWLELERKGWLVGWTLENNNVDNEYRNDMRQRKQSISSQKICVQFLEDEIQLAAKIMRYDSFENAISNFLASNVYSVNFQLAQQRKYNEIKQIAQTESQVNRANRVCYLTSFSIIDQNSSTVIYIKIIKQLNKYMKFLKNKFGAYNQILIDIKEMIE